MSIRRLFLPMLVLLAAACADGPTTPGSSGHGARPNFLRWSPMANPQFEANAALDVSTSTKSGHGVRVADLVSAPEPVAVDRASTASTSAQQLSWSHTVGSGENRFLLVGVSIRNGRNTVDGVTYAGRALSFVGAQANSDAAVSAEIWKLSAPPTGTAAVTVSLSGGAKVVGGAVSFTGVDPMNPLGAFMSVGGADNTIDPSIELGNAVGDGLAFAVVSLEGSAKTLTPFAGESGQYSRFYGLSGGDAAGAGSVASGASASRMGWTKGAKAKWTIGAVVLRRTPNLGVAANTYEASFWAVRGTPRTVQINHVSGGVTSPYLRFTAVDPTFAPGVGTLAIGDSVLITVRVDSTKVAARFSPAGLQFGSASPLTFWYGVLGGDLDGDGMVNAFDTNIEQQLLGMWYQASPMTLWEKIGATVSTQEKSVTTDVWHFSEYAVSW